ncbi:TRAP transporter small permease [Pseudovibrio sp. SPO723]|uniref:TRAP transporter small permease n=1 Tax=Nesiotobacter zosterae TaxID=392721 RepID=UPI0029C3F44D|nr:TRAP transporter small permease [Pseudovibrio sp. SPO723]MDX5595199.1 TRAP transporter small permease [Pseudovibrio sp. SPO723]
MTATRPPHRTASLKRLAEVTITGWAMAGGVLLLLVVAVNMISVIGGIFGHPFPGDFELTEMGVAIAAFSFLPYCQLKDANVTADVFTARASIRIKAVLSLVASLIALGFALLLLWRMYLGMEDQRLYEYTTTILQIPHWLAFVPILISLALLSIAAMISLLNATTTALTRYPYG